MPVTDDKKTQLEPDRIPVKIVVDSSGQTDRIYSNHVQLRITPFDATLEFCEVEPPTEEDMKKSSERLEVKARPKVRIVLPLGVYTNLIKLMAEQAEDLTSQKEEK